MARLTKEQTMDIIISNYGFESRWTIWFCELAEVLTLKQLELAFSCLIAMRQGDVEED